jgi:hypothetical protein
LIRVLQLFVSVQLIYKRVFICWLFPAVVLFALYLFYSFSHTYAQLIGLYNMHSLSVKCRRFDTLQLLLPFNGPIKLFHSCPFVQSDDSSLLILFFLSLHREVLVHYWQYVFLIVHMNNPRYLIAFFLTVGMYYVCEIQTKRFSFGVLSQKSPWWWFSFEKIVIWMTNKSIFVCWWWLFSWYLLITPSSCAYDGHKTRWTHCI